MNEHESIDRLLTAWTDEMWSPPAPAYLADVLARTRHTRQRRAWASLERWLPMAVITQRPASNAMQRAWHLCVVLLMLALVAGGIVAGGLAVGSQLFQVTSPIPTGGSAVLVFDSADGDLYTVRADGTDKRQLTSGPERDTAAVWSPDGTRVAFRRVAPDGTSVAVVDAAGGEPVILYTVDPPTDDTCIPHAPAWSPNGEFLVFAADACQGPATIVVAAAGSRGPVDAVPFLPVGTLGSAPSWARPSDDTTSVAFIGSGADGDGVYVADISDERRIQAEPRFPIRRISDTDRPSLWTVGGLAPLSGPMWSPDGTSVAVAAGTNNECTAAGIGSMDAFVLDTRPGQPGQETVAGSDAKEYNPTWSPDGKQLAFQRVVEPSERVRDRPCTMAVWITDREGGAARRLTMLGTDDSQPPLWSPDGTRIVGNSIEVIDGVEHYDLYIETVDGSSPVVTVDDVGWATWQPVAAPIGPGVSPAAS